MDVEEYRKDIERKILISLEEQLQLGEMSAERAKEIAQYVLQTIGTATTREEIYYEISQLSERYPEFSQIFFEVHDAHEEEMKAKVAHQVDDLLAQGNIDRAADLLHDTLHHDDEGNISV